MLQEALTAATGVTVVGTTVLVPVNAPRPWRFRIAGSDKVGTIRMLERQLSLGERRHDWFHGNAGDTGSAQPGVHGGPDDGRHAQ